MLDGLQIDPVAFVIPIGEGFPVYWYGILIAIGIALGAWWAGREIEKRGESSEILYNGLLIVVIAGYLFARLGFVIQDELTQPGTQYSAIGDVLNLRAGGSDLVWGLIGGALVGWLYLLYKKVNVWHYADVAGPAVLLAQAIGRWGNFINQELYGPPTTLPWGVMIDVHLRLAPYNDFAAYPPTTRFHPVFLYESILLFIGFGLLVYLNNRFREQWKPGTLFGLFLIYWGGVRLLVSFLRPDLQSIGNGPFTYAALFSALLMIVGIAILLYLYDRLPLKPQRATRQRVRKPRRKRSTDTQPESSDG